MLLILLQSENILYIFVYNVCIKLFEIIIYVNFSIPIIILAVNNVTWNCMLPSYTYFYIITNFQVFVIIIHINI